MNDNAIQLSRLFSVQSSSTSEQSPKPLPEMLESVKEGSEAVEKGSDRWERERDRYDSRNSSSDSLEAAEKIVDRAASVMKSPWVLSVDMDKWRLLCTTSDGTLFMWNYHTGRSCIK